MAWNRHAIEQTIPLEDVNLDPLFRLARQPVERRDHFLLEEGGCS